MELVRGEVVVDITIPRRQPPARRQVKIDLYKLMLAQSDIGVVGKAWYVAEIKRYSKPELREFRVIFSVRRNRLR